MTLFFLNLLLGVMGLGTHKMLVSLGTVRVGAIAMH